MNRSLLFHDTLTSTKCCQIAAVAALYSAMSRNYISQSVIDNTATHVNNSRQKAKLKATDLA